MKNDPQPPITPKMQNQYENDNTESDYVYDNAKDEGRVHRPLMGGGWVTHYQRCIVDAYKCKPVVSLRARARWGSDLQRDMIKLEIARRGFYIKKVWRIGPNNDTHRLCKIGISNNRRVNDEVSIPL